MTDVTSRLDLPLLSPGQAGKELVHNEALSALAIIVQASVVAAGVDAPPPDPVIGRAWIVGDAPVGAWAGRGHMIAGWTAGGWRFVVPTEGMTAWIEGERLTARFDSGAWTIGQLRARRLVIDGRSSVGPAEPAVPAPVGGGNIDVESRASIVAILNVLRQHGLTMA